MFSLTFRDDLHDLIEGGAVAAFIRSRAKRRRKRSSGGDHFSLYWPLRLWYGAPAMRYSTAGHV